MAAEFDPEEFYEDEEVGGGSPSVRRVYWRAIQTLLIALGIQTIAGLSPSMIENYYSQKIYLYIPWLLAKANQQVETSLAEVFFLVLIGVFLLWGLWSAIRAYQGRAPLRDSLKVILLYIIWTASILFIVFKLLWGLNYQRLPLAEVARFEPRYARTEELQEIGNLIANGIRTNSNAPPTTPSSNVPDDPTSRTVPPVELKAIASNLELAFRVTDLFRRFDQWTFGSPKFLESSPLIKFLGIRSFYLPFTGEVSVQRGLSSVDLPFAIARAMAYQRGYAREDEVNFVAYLVCVNATDARIRYSGYVHGARVLLALERSGIGSYIDGLGDESTRLIRQREAEAAWSFGGLASSFVEGLFNFHLRVNRVVAGTRSADGDIDLIVSYYLADKKRLTDRFLDATRPGASGE
ncbi:MAG: DUF3810 family protein [Acidobacteriota bacterium]